MEIWSAGRCVLRSGEHGFIVDDGIARREMSVADWTRLFVMDPDAAMGGKPKASLQQLEAVESHKMHDQYQQAKLDSMTREASS